MQRLGPGFSMVATSGPSISQRRGRSWSQPRWPGRRLPHRPLLWRKLCHCCHQLRASHSGSLSIPGRTSHQIGVVFTRLLSTTWSWLGVGTSMGIVGGPIFPSACSDEIVVGSNVRQVTKPVRRRNREPRRIIEARIEEPTDSVHLKVGNEGIPVRDRTPANPSVKIHSPKPNAGGIKMLPTHSCPLQHRR